MKILTGITGIACFFALTCQSHATSINVDGTFDETGEWAGSYTDGDGSVGPGGGGQDYDIESLGLKLESGQLYFGMQTGFDLQGRQDDSNLTNFWGGDFALDTNGNVNDGYEYAIDYSIDDSGNVTFTLVDMGSVKGDDLLDYSDPGAAFGWREVGYPDLDNRYDHSISNPLEALNYTNANTIDGVTGAYGDTDHYVLEGMFDSSLIDITGGLTLHWTMACGNDHLETTATAPVPEPATMLLFGTGLAGLATVRRKKNKKS